MPLTVTEKSLQYVVGSKNREKLVEGLEWICFHLHLTHQHHHQNRHLYCYANVTSICVTVLFTTIIVVNTKRSSSILILLVHIASDIPLTCVRRSAERKVTTLGKLVYIREMLLVAALDKLVYYHLLYNISLSSSYLAIFVKRPKMPIVENRTPSHQNSNAFHAFIAIS